MAARTKRPLQRIAYAQQQRREGGKIYTGTVELWINASALLKDLGDRALTKVAIEEDKS
jgi:hypothetical protein